MGQKMTPQELADARMQDAEWIKDQWKGRRPKAYQKMKADGSLDSVTLAAGDELNDRHNELLRAGVKEPEAYLQAKRDVIAIPDE